MTPTTLKYFSYSVLLSALLSGCGGSNRDSADATANSSTTLEANKQSSFNVSGTLTGLSSGKQLLLINNHGDQLLLDSNGAFRFPTPFANGDDYAVTVLKQPEGHACSASNSQGAIAGAHVANVMLSCESAPAPTVQVAALTVNTPNSALQSVVINNNLPSIYSGQQLSVKLTTFQPCGAGGCSFYSYTTNRLIFPIPASFPVAEGATQNEILMTVNPTPYATPVLIYAGAKSLWINVFPALGTPASDGSYTMLGFGNSTRTGTGSVTKSMNLTLAIRNMDSQIATYATKQCEAAIPGGKLTRVGNYTVKGEYKNANGLLAYDVTQRLKCAP